jgi:hypothetical protein
MDRRNVLKSVGGTVLMPSISVPPTDSVPFDYLDSLFASNYSVEKTPNGVLGKTYSAEWEAENRDYNMEYRVFSESENKVDVRVNAVDFCFEHYYWNPSEHLDAFNLLETGRKNGLEDLLTVMKHLNLDSVEVRI